MSAYSLPLTQAALTFGPEFVCPGAGSVQLTVANQACLIQTGRGIAGIQWSDDSYRIPGVHVIPGPVDAVRVRQKAATPTGGKPAQYAIDAYV